MKDASQAVWTGTFFVVTVVMAALNLNWITACAVTINSFLFGLAVGILVSRDPPS